jgi:stage II sporulation protein D
VGTEGTVTLTGLAIRRALGIRENLFFLDAQRGPDGKARSWVFTGRGWGHGVGLCQVGAYGMAAAGHDYREILSHYYAGTRVVSRGQGPLRPSP